MTIGDGIMCGRIDIPASCLRKSSFPYSVIFDLDSSSFCNWKRTVWALCKSEREEPNESEMV